MSGPVLSARSCARSRVIADPLLAPDGSRASAVVRTHGTAELVVVPVGGGAEVVVSGDPDVAGAHPSGGGAHCWSPDGGSILYVGRDGGLWSVPAGGGPARVVVPAGRAPEMWSPAVSPDGAHLAWVEDTRRVMVAPLDPSSPDPSGPARSVSHAGEGEAGPDFALDPVWSADSGFLAWVEWDVPAMPWDAGRLVVAGVADGERRVVAGGPEESVQQPRFSPSGELGYVSDRDGWANLWVVDPAGGVPQPLLAEDHEHAEPAWGPGQRSWCWSPDGRAVAVCRNEGGFARLVVVARDGAVGDGTVSELGRGWHTGLGWAGDRILAVRSGARTPTRLVAVPAAGGARTELVRGPTGGVEGPWLVEPEVVSWSGPGGHRVPGRLYRPPDGAAGVPPRLLLWIHGGPTGQMTVTFNARVAYFLSRGWAVLAPDYRGSTGWGRAHAQALAGGWGEADVADCAAGLEAAAEEGWGRPGAMVPIGGSSGGMTVLALLAFHGDRCAAGVDLYGVADLERLAATTHRYEAHYTDRLVGPLPGAAATYRERSPLTWAERIRRPLLVLHGSEDRVVPLGQSLALVERIREAGGHAELHVYEGEGHGWSQPATVEDELGRIEAFLDRHVPAP